MPRPVLPIALTLAVLAEAAAAQEVPDLPLPAIGEATGEAFALCREVGGSPQLSEDFVRAADLNGDGVEDYLVDFFGFFCEGAPSVLCGSAGCPVTVWLSGPEGHTAAWSGMAQTSRIADSVVVLDLHGSQCSPPRIGADGCEQRLTFAAAEAGPEEAVAAEAGAEGAAPAPRPAEARPVSEGPVGGWSLRAVPDGDPVAVSGGPGRIEEAAVFCLSGEGWLALTLEPRPVTEAAAVAFTFSGDAVEVEARLEPGAGGAYVVGLSDGPLAGLLAGRDRAVAVAIDGEAQGVLSLAGSTRAIRGALAPCGGT